MANNVLELYDDDALNSIKHDFNQVEKEAYDLPRENLDAIMSAPIKPGINKGAQTYTMKILTKLGVDGKPKARTAHSLNPVPAVVWAPGLEGRVAFSGVEGSGISSLAATCLNLLGYQTPEGYDPSLVTVK